jgi:hypothetical protein
MAYLDGDPIPALKAFINTLPIGANPTNYLQESDINFILNALSEIRTRFGTISGQIAAANNAITATNARIDALIAAGGGGGGGPPPPPPPTTTSPPSVDSGFPMTNYIQGSTATGVSVVPPVIQSGKLLVAVVNCINATNTTVTVNGLGLSWVKVKETLYSNYVNASIWAAWTNSATSSSNVTASVASGQTLAKTMSITLYALSGAKSGASSAANSFGALSGSATSGAGFVTLAGTTVNSLLLSSIAWAFQAELIAASGNAVVFSVASSTPGARIEVYRYTGTTGGDRIVGASGAVGGGPINARAVNAAEILPAPV